MKRDQAVAVIGGGVIGITTAVLLQANGFRTVVYTRERPSHEPDIVRDPAFSTLHAAASVLPHSVESPHVNRWTSISQQFFSALSFRAACGVRPQAHYEMFESSAVEPPSYAAAVSDFEMIGGPGESPDLLGKDVPRRPGAKELQGWRFSAFFCEVPEYIRYLYDLYEELGGRVFVKEQTAASLGAYLDEPHKFFVNAAGSASQQLLADSSRDPEFERRFQVLDEAHTLPGIEPLADKYGAKLVRGHYIRADIKELLRNVNGAFYSYNYKPGSDIYRNGDGSPADVYCYPRSDAWILGGSRQLGERDEAGRWHWATGDDSTVCLERDEDDESVDVPRPILELNAQLLVGITDGRLDLMQEYRQNPRMFSPGVGYRFLRDGPDNVRLATSAVCDNNKNGDLRERYILHNYGHGGSGFTLSWGCALEVLKQIDTICEADSRQPLSRDRRKFVVGHAATRMMLVDLTARLLQDNEL